MTVSSSVGRQWTIGQLISSAYKFAGLINVEQEPRPKQVKFAQELLEDILDLVDVDGFQARTVEFVDVTLTSGTSKYTMDAKYVDLTSPGMYIAASETDITKASGETPVDIINRQEWQRYSTKSSQGRVYKCYVHRVGDALQLYLWPIPDEAGTIRFMAQRELADADLTTATFDLRNYWMEYLKCELAAQLAQTNSLPPTTIALLTQKAQGASGKAKRKGTQTPNNVIYVSHSSGYGRRR